MTSLETCSRRSLPSRSSVSLNRRPWRSARPRLSRWARRPRVKAAQAFRPPTASATIAYTIAKLDQLIRARGLALDFDQVWKAQTIPSALASVLLDIAQTIRPAVTQPGSSVANVTEWAKKQACWARVQDVPFELPETMEVMLLDPQSRKAAVSDARKTQKMDNGIEAQSRVVQLGPDHWAAAAQFAAGRKLLTPADHSLFRVAARPGSFPTEKQSIRLMSVLDNLEAEGFQKS